MNLRIDQLTKGAVLRDDVINAKGVLLMGRGAVLGDAGISFLAEQGITSVEVVDPEYDKRTPTEIISEKPQEYKVSAEEIENAIDSESIFKEQYTAGIEAIKNVDVDATEEIAKDICNKVLGSSDLQNELSLLKKGFDSVLSHSMNVAIYTASVIVWEANVTSQICYETVMGAMLHDIGKLYVPREVLDKPAKLTDQEYKIMQQHAELGYMKLSSTGNLSENICQMAYQHHENVDGTGYPRHLRGEDILLESKIIHVADVYEAMTARRCYKPPMLPGDVTEFTMSKFGSMFDERILKTFLSTVPAYKKGDTVMLSNNMIATVTASNSLNSLRPKVRLMQTGQELDLFRDRNNLNITIIDMV